MEFDHVTNQYLYPDRYIKIPYFLNKTTIYTLTYLDISNLDFSEYKNREDMFRFRGNPQVVTIDGLLLLGPVLVTLDLQRERGTYNSYKSTKCAGFEH
jgi:hypothetical protein